MGVQPTNAHAPLYGYGTGAIRMSRCPGLHPALPSPGSLFYGSLLVLFRSLGSDGYGLYGYLDIGGATPVVDECGGHFGYTNDSAQTV